ncbi:hypothetical protein HPB51_021422 [Rhipicephalus microplus]|uniref:Uncharacterized protein n=1 Tax=Rhipicephalus microplus TaxID=6941 RepID=A0A9J6DP95_RHIMP|nr:hypothetical protein HPB51_021422 [Rhipicephalus microplus]
MHVYPRGESSCKTDDRDLAPVRQRPLHATKLRLVHTSRGLADRQRVQVCGLPSKIGILGRASPLSCHCLYLTTPRNRLAGGVPLSEAPVWVRSQVYRKNLSLDKEHATGRTRCGDLLSRQRYRAHAERKRRSGSVACRDRRSVRRTGSSMFLFASPAAPGVERDDGRGDRDDNEAFYARRRLQEEHRRRREQEERNRRAMTPDATREK